MPLAACQLFQLLVRLFQAVAAHHGLDRLGEHFPVVVQIVGDARRVGEQLAQAAAAGFRNPSSV
jgi:hypothetical protein